MSNFILNFITEKDFEEHIEKTIKEYNEILKSVNLKQFNSNIIDPIKLLFDKNIFNKSYEEIIALEIQRQRDKSNNNAIGYFHQNMFKHIKNCEVPEEYWDIIYRSDDGTNYYVEMKNKHNTMNSAAAKSTYIKMQNHLLNSDDKENSVCALVEVIAKQSQNREWAITIDKVKQTGNPKLRRISIDKFYEIVTGDKQAFAKLCQQLPKTIEKILQKQNNLKVQKDTVLTELHKIDKDILVTLYKLAFKTYDGFDWQ